MCNCEVALPHLRVEQVRLAAHAADVQLHDRLRELLVVQHPTLTVLVVEGCGFVLFEIAPELIQSALELLKIGDLLIS